MNLVVNLYKEQSTIKGFEDSVRSLKDDIATHLKSSPKKKDETMKELRSEIQKTAAAKLEGKICDSNVSDMSLISDLDDLMKCFVKYELKKCQFSLS